MRGYSGARMDDDLSIRITQDGTTAIVAAAGEIDISNVGDLRAAVDRRGRRAATASAST